MSGNQTPEMAAHVKGILDNIDRRRRPMAKPKEPTKTCPDCGGGGVRRVRYADPETTCPTCNGNGVVPADAEVAQEAEDESTAAKPKADTA